MKVKNLIPAVLLALALSATFALADYDFEGEGSGECDTFYPWAQWIARVTTAAEPYVSGKWWHGDYANPNHWGWINHSDASYNGGTGCYVVSEGTWDCQTETNLDGEWQGGFCPGSDTANGTWWDYDWDCYGTLGGNLAE